MKGRETERGNKNRESDKPLSSSELFLEPHYCSSTGAVATPLLLQNYSDLPLEMCVCVCVFPFAPLWPTDKK